ncbi:aminotransferase class III-fold pyridoxal phosphate-dependent enzyme [Galbibacter sp. EGI 63066]|uniref:aspartate aminotransferase family protein n=1 Tax=Galbibacter sp. EGI 63066 TaxID=2993559 RepID=UPI0022497862|nr:aminotransferase class III-fold pyridoxal phosphate-dependent enzyme [Galbibacter sp. EGI 63066]MCX2678725.1 aminotransferase class III-fold pyridoxal phosphate-dependent enzyme [Galbibacter sp. EGI 63066]
MNLFDVYPLYNVTPVKGKDVYVYDNSGQEYLDLYGGHAVISIGHAHPTYVERITEQVNKLGFYSNAVQNPLQVELAEKLGRLSNCEKYNLFLCNSGAEANENALKLASFKTGKSRVIAFKNAFHGRTSAAVAATDNRAINAPINNQHSVTTFLPFNQLHSLDYELAAGDVCAVIIEPIQGVGGLDEPTTEFLQGVEKLCKKHNAVLILDEIQSGYGRSGKFFAFQHHDIEPDIITVAKGMANGFPIGGVLIHPKFEAKHGMLGTTFGGNHMACAAAIAVLEVLENEKLIENVNEISSYFKQKVKKIKSLQRLKGKGLMLGMEFAQNVSGIRKDLIYEKKIFTGGSSNKNLLRILPPLTITKDHVDTFIESLSDVLKNHNL